MRLAGERTLLDPRPDDGHADDSPLDAAGPALVAVGALPAEWPSPSWTTTPGPRLPPGWAPSSPSRAGAAFGSHRSQPPPQPGHAADGAVPTAHRAVVGPVVPSLPGLAVRGRPSLHVEMRAAATPPGPASPSTPPRFASCCIPGPASPGPVPRSRRVGVSGPGFPQQLSLTDDRGDDRVRQPAPAAATTASGTASSRPARALAEGTAWIEVLGERVELPACAFLACSEAWVEPLGGQDSWPCGLPVGQGRGHGRVPLS